MYLKSALVPYSKFNDASTFAVDSLEVRACILCG